MGDAPIELRAATDGDHDFLLTLNLAAYREVVTQQFGWDPADQEARFTDKWARARYRVVELNAEPVGALWTSDEDKHVIVHEILVHPEHQGRGIGTAVMERVFAEADARLAGVRLQVLHANRARALYERLGLSVYDESETHYLMRRPRQLGKAFAYVTRGRQLLVFEHVGIAEAGVQVPAGTLEIGEAPEAAVVREAMEETGLGSFGAPTLLGTGTWEAEHDAGPERHTRHFFHLPLHGEAPDRWRHEAEEGDGRFTFELYWVDLPEGAAQLIAKHDDCIDMLMARLEGT